jgi:dTDP-L-rhamnose 4-epimerase
MRVLVTGGAGFVGSAVTRALQARGHAVRVLDLSPPAGTDGVEHVAGDVRDPASVARALAGVDVVCHLAAKVGLGVDLDDLPGYASVNDVGTATLLSGMARSGVGRLVLAGSMVVYGEGRYSCPAHGVVPALPRAADDLRAGRFDPRCPACGEVLSPRLVPEDAPADPRSGYAVSKLAQELLCRVWRRETGGSLTILRYHNVYGPGMPRDTPYAGVASIFASALGRGEAPRVFEDGAQRRDFVSVHDVASATATAAEHLLEHGVTPGSPIETGVTPCSTRQGVVRVYNVGSGEVRTVLDMASALASALGGPAPRVTGEFRLGDVRHVTADTSRLRAELGWRPRVAFEDGMRALVTADLRDAVRVS